MKKRENVLFNTAIFSVKAKFDAFSSSNHVLPPSLFFTMPIIPHYFHAVSHSYRLVKNTVLRKTFQVLRRTLVLFSITRKSPIFFSFTYLFCFFIDFLSLHSLIFLSSVKIFSFQRENQFYKKKRKI